MELKLYRFLNIRESVPLSVWLAAGITLVASIGLLDYATGHDIDVALFYLIPIVLVTWSVNEAAGLAISVLSAVSWLAAELTGRIINSPGIYFWNTLIHASFFFTVAHLVAELQKSHQKEQRAARTDFLTGAMNRRYFHELLQMEIDRIPRYGHPFTVVYLDLDNFKQMNDRYGHEMGDEVLRTIAGQMKAMLRRTDIIARLGGDEFAVLLPFANPAGAECAVGRVHLKLKEIVGERNWPVTVSMGAVTCIAAPDSLEHLLSLADKLMYEVKKSTKNNIHFMTWAG